MMAGVASVAWALRADQVYVGTGGLRVGSAANNWSKFTVNGSTGNVTMAGVIVRTVVTTTGNAWTLDGSTVTTGNMVKLIGVDATLNGGKYVNIFGGTNATSVWSVGESGQTTITPNVATVQPFYVDSTLTTTADIIKVKAVDATLNGGYYINLLGGAGATSVWSVAEGGVVATSQTLTSQTLERAQHDITLNTDSSFLSGSNMTYSSAYGSSALKVTGTYSGLTGGYSGLVSRLTTSGAIATDGAGVIGIKSVVTNTAAMTDGEVYGGQFIAKHNHATNVMSASASLIGLESWAYDSGAGPARTAIGGNFGYHNEGTIAKGGGSVYRGVQIFTDDAAGSSAADERTSLCLWNQAGTQTNGIKFVKSDGGWTQDITLQYGEGISNANDGEVALTGTLTAPAVTPVSDATATRVCTSADYGKVIILSQAGAVAVTLPANGAAAGSWIDFMVLSSNDTAPTISAATVDTMVGPNDIDLDSVTWATANRIGAYARFISDGSFWHALNLGGTTMTYTD